MLIFDLDQTLVDTSSVEQHRRAKRWGPVKAACAHLPVYPGIADLIESIAQVGRPMAIVTKSPDMIARAFVAQHSWPIAHIVGYHQVNKQKPDPEGLILAMKLAGARPEDTLHIGDRDEDTKAARAANVKAIGAGWGALDLDALRASQPEELFMSVKDFAAYLRRP